MKLYLSGPMTGIPEFNYPAFNNAAARLRAIGHDVINPAENDDGDTDREWGYYIRKDIKQLVECEGIVLLPGWENSKGAKLEKHIAEELGMTVFFYNPLSSCTDLIPVEPTNDLPTETILEEAAHLVHGNRGSDYGHPIDDFSRTGKIWGAILGVDVAPEQVALCMVGVKISRECNKPKRDNRVDGAGYFETLDMVVAERERRNS